MKIFDKRACFLNFVNSTSENALSLTIETPNEKKTVSIVGEYSTMSVWIPSNAVIRWNFEYIPSVVVNGTKRPEWAGGTPSIEKVVGGFSAGDVVVFKVGG